MIEALPKHLLERTRVLEQKTIRAGESSTEFVLYWMRTAVRCDENPALDVARWISIRQGIPLLVYHAISEHYEFASDRHHMFMLQGARDVQTQMDRLGISYAFHLANRHDRRPHLANLSELASVVVTEDMPVDSPRRFLAALAGKTETPIILVDTACVAPMQLIGKAHTRAFQFRSATQDIYADRLTRAWPDVLDDAVKSFDCSTLPFAPLDLQAVDLAQQIAECEIDHAIGPVVDTIGGSKAGYRRWNVFKEQGLGRYAKQRNHALLDGVSRMSPYLHYGMVSPFRIARETAEVNSAGSEKYLDELLIWRELAYAFCFYRQDHDQWSALPDWARETLREHAADHREQTYSWETLARGETDDQFWNAAQKSLLRQGELHNNVRMTWGKAILNWKQDPEEALQTILDLNHRYALDGRDPASYGGILWCLGQFDRPFKPEQSIVGTVRQRPTSVHASRMDTQEYHEKVTSPRFDPVLNVAIVGAGISGLFAARTLQDHGCHVAVFEKSRGVGGRMSTRRAGSQQEALAFDHGAQYFTARDPRFIRYVESWMEQGLVARWPDAQLGGQHKIVVLENGIVQAESSSVARFVGQPSMNSVCKHLARNIEITTQTRIGKVATAGERIELLGESGVRLGVFDRLIVSAPAGQATELLVDFPGLAGQISQIEMKPCWATMVAFEKPITDQWVGAFLHNSFLSWAARNGSKPGRNRDREQLVIHANPDWTAEHWEHDANEVAQRMLTEFWKVAGIEPVRDIHIQSHRWKFAIPVESSGSGCFTNDAVSIVACGDWACGSRIEGAFLSGMAAAGRVLGTRSPSSSQATRQSKLPF